MPLKLVRLVDTTGRRYAKSTGLGNQDPCETLVITRQGRAITRIVPEEGRRQREVEAGLHEIAEVRRKTRPIAVKDLLSARDQGRRPDGFCS